MLTLFLVTTPVTHTHNYSIGIILIWSILIINNLLITMNRFFLFNESMHYIHYDQKSFCIYKYRSLHR